MNTEEKEIKEIRIIPTNLIVEIEDTPMKLRNIIIPVLLFIIFLFGLARFYFKLW